MGDKIVTLVIITFIVTTLAWIIIYLAIRSVRSAKRSPPWAGAIGWALMFLSVGRIPLPPPTTQIEENIAGKKDSESSRDIGLP